MSLDSDSRPKFKGLTVPWVTRWSGEKNVADKLGMYSGVFVDERTDEAIPLNVLVYKDHMTPEGEPTETWFSDRDEDGILWLRDNGPQDGPPEFSQVHALRQSQAMRQALCQVCGSQLDKDNVPWLMSEAQYGLALREGKREGMKLATGNPPTCEPCQEIAVKQCPHLKHGFRRFYVQDYRPCAVFGDVAVVRDDAPVLERETLRLEDRRILGMVGRQMVVEWLDFKEVAWRA